MSYSLKPVLQTRFEFALRLSQAWDARALQRSAAGVCAALLALRKLPVIRYASSSPLCQKLAEVRLAPSFHRHHHPPDAHLY